MAIDIINLGVLHHCYRISWGRPVRLSEFRHGHRTQPLKVRVSEEITNEVALTSRECRQTYISHITFPLNFVKCSNSVHTQMIN